MIWIAVILLYVFCVILLLCCGYLYNQVTLAGRIMFEILKAYNELKKRVDDLDSARLPTMSIDPTDPEIQ